MRRRTLLASLAGLTGTSALAAGSGAFTQVTAARTVSVETADDSAAVLALEQLGDGKRSLADGTPEQVEFSFPGYEELREDPSLGLGTDSVYEFDQDTAEPGSTAPVEGLLRITNQGTQQVAVDSEHETSSELTIELYDVTDTEKVALRDDPAVLDVGDHVDVGFRIETFGADLGSFDETLTVVAEATGA